MPFVTIAPFVSLAGPVSEAGQPWIVTICYFLWSLAFS